MSNHEGHNTPENKPIKIENSTIFTEAEKLDVKPKNTNTKLIIIFTAIIIFVVGSIFAVKLFWKTDDSVVEPIDDNTVYKLTADANVPLDEMENKEEGSISNIKKVVVNNEKDSFEAVPFKDSNDVFFKIKGYDNVPQDKEKVTKLCESVFNVNAVKKLDEKYTLEDCGLVSPKVSVTVSLADNSTFTFKLGNKVPDGYGNYYGLSSLVEGIYIVDSEVFNDFSKIINDFVDTLLVEPITMQGENDNYFVQNNLAKYDNITISGARLKNDIKLAYDENRKEVLIYSIVSPVSAYASDEKIHEILAPLQNGFVASTAYEVNPTKSDLAKYGLDKPNTEFTYTIKGKTYNLRFSKLDVKDAGYYACTVDNIPVIYMVMTDLYKFIEWDVNDFRNNMLYAVGIAQLKSVTAEFENQKIKYDISTYKQTPDYGDTADDLPEDILVKRGGAPVNSEEFKRMYQWVLWTKAVDYLDIGEKIPNLEPRLKLTFEYSDDSPPDVMKFIKHGERYYSYSINNVGDELVRYDTVDDIINNIKKLNRGETVDSPY